MSTHALRSVIVSNNAVCNHLIFQKMNAHILIFIVFANLFYEFNNPGLDQGSSNLKCAVYADIHSAAEKTNLGGQQLAPPPAGLTYIQQSSGYAAKTLVDPTNPDGYELV